MCCKRIYNNNLQVFENHSNNDYHKTSVLKGENFIQLFSSNKPNIVEILDSERYTNFVLINICTCNLILRIKQKKQNRLNLIPIIECIILCIGLWSNQF